MNTMVCLCLLSCVGYFAVITCQESTESISSRHLAYLRKNNNGLFEKTNRFQKSPISRNHERELSTENNLDWSSMLSSERSQYSAESPRKLLPRVLHHSNSHRTPRFAKLSSKEAGLHQSKSSPSSMSRKSPRQTLDEIIRYNFLESPNQLGGIFSGPPKYELPINQPKITQEQNLVTQGRLSELVTIDNEVPGRYPESQKIEDPRNQKLENSVQPMFTSMKNSEQLVAAVNPERYAAQTTGNKINIFQSSLNSPPASTEKNKTVQLTSQNTNNLENIFTLKPGSLNRFSQPQQILGQLPHSQPPSSGLDAFISLLQENNPTLKLQRSSQFIPICPEVDNITEIYWELCKDFGCDEEFFDELKKKHWTEEVLRIKGLPAPTPAFFEPQPIISPPQSFLIPESPAVPSFKTNNIPQAPLDFAPKGQEFTRILTNNPPRALTDEERVSYPKTILPEPISKDLDNSINFVNTDSRTQRYHPGSWSQQIPGVISSKDLSSLNNIVIPLEARTFTKSASSPGSSFPCVNYPFQNTETLAVLKAPQSPVMYPFNGFEHVLNNCNNIINRAPEVVAEKLVEAELETEVEEPEIEKEPKSESESETEEEESDEAPVIEVEAFPEFNQVVKTKMIKAQMLEQDGNIIFLPESESESDESKEKSGSKSDEEKSVEIQVHVTKFKCSQRNTPENKRMAKIDLKDVHKGETWPHLTYLKLIPLSESFEEELIAREEAEEISQLLKAAQGNGTSDIQPINKVNATEAADKGFVDESAGGSGGGASAPGAPGPGNAGGTGGQSTK